MPFAGYETFNACVIDQKAKGKKKPEAMCAAIHKKATGKWPHEMSKETQETAEQELINLMTQPISGEFAESVRLLETDSESDGYVFDVVVIEEGMNKSNTREYTKAAIHSMVPMVEGLQCFVDHPTRSEARERGERSIRDVFGWYDSGKLAESEDGKAQIMAKLHLLKEGPNAEVANMIREAAQRGNPNLVGLSIRAAGEVQLVNQRGKIYEKVHLIESLVSADAVTRPGAGGKVKSIAESENEKLRRFYMDLSEMTSEEILAARPDLAEALAASADTSGEATQTVVATVTEAETPGETANDVAEAKDTALAEIAEARRAVVELAEAQKVEAATLAVDKALATENLPDPIKAMVRSKLEGKVVTNDEIQEAIAGGKDMWEQLLGERTPSARSFTTSEVTKDEQEGLLKRLDATVLGHDVDDHPPFRGLREAYQTMKRDNSFRSSPELASQIVFESNGYSGTNGVRPHSYTTLLEEADLTSTSWATILGTSIHRIMLKLYNEGPYREWEQVVSDIDIVSDIKTISYSRTGGYTVTPVVAEGAPYQERTVPEEEKPTIDFDKYGDLQPLTIESIINDDLRALRQIPRQLAFAAQFTIYKKVFDFMANNSNVWDGTALAHANHGSNTSTTALSADALEAAVKAMRKQTNTGSTDRPLSLRPKMLIVPTALEETAFQLTTSDVKVLSSAFNATQPNLYRDKYGLTHMVVDYWSDDNNWWVIGDPMMMETIRVALYPAREPEFFTQDEPTAGSVFTADKVTYKTRFFMGAAVTDYRSFFGAIVS